MISPLDGTMPQVSAPLTMPTLFIDMTQSHVFLFIGYNVIIDSIYRYDFTT